MILLLDIGNTRFKSAWLSGAELQSQAPWMHDGALPAGLYDNWIRHTPPEAIWICNVGPADLTADIRSFAEARWQAPVFQLNARHRRAGVVNAYRQPDTLGADRWAALLGAMSQRLAPCSIIDCGTALTLDALDADGHHLGGQIVPGMRLMREALGLHTAGVGHHDASDRTPVFGRSTGEAVAAGVLQACLAAIREFHRHTAERLAPERPRLLLTGGDAPVLLKALSVLEPVHCPDLVLQGLAAAVGDSEA
ncbi:type III pantothenate kinase [Methylonatrum kenyense]|uniref:type III pantothenate kinase n=1 Tax=Methylonatrum kenyense TaxID=455253 RepID=UPI0020C03183|nr:type III pantothenate kinase [Methylonatrum kenyense]MCK8517165.1 type III pantothenate kinase [Methylonatrum kenyense]